MKYIKEWLKENKIFFETIAIVLLSTMAIIVSIQSNKISSSQLRIAEDQKRIMVAQNLPLLRLNAYQVYTKETDKYSEDIIKIVNEGPPLYEFHKDYVVFIEFEFGKRGEALSKILIPLNGYYGSSFLTGESKNLLCTITGPKNKLKYDNFISEFRSLAEKEGYYAFDKLRRFININYKDLFEQRHSDFYEVDFFNSKKMEPEEGQKYFTLHYQSHTNLSLVEFTTIFPDEIFGKCKMILPNKANSADTKSRAAD